MTTLIWGDCSLTLSIVFIGHAINTSDVDKKHVIKLKINDDIPHVTPQRMDELLQACDIARPYTGDLDTALDTIIREFLSTRYLIHRIISFTETK